MNQFICFDIGGTAIKCALVDADGTMHQRRIVPTSRQIGTQILELSREYLENNAAAGIAISSAGVVDSDNGRILFAGDTLPGYTGTDFKKLLADLPVPVEVENDVNCAGLTEYALGSAKGASSALILTVGTGIGGCFIEKGRLLHGHCGCACEVGFVPMEGSIFQNVASAGALVRNVTAVHGGSWDGRKVFEAAAAGDRVCQEEIDKMCERLGTGIASLCFALNPAVVVLGGGIMTQHAVLEDKIRAAFDAHTFPLLRESTEIRYADFGNAAGLQGALVHFLQKHPGLAK